jgi:hypothetical protein
MTIVEMGMRDSGIDYKKFTLPEANGEHCCSSESLRSGAGLRCNLTRTCSKLETKMKLALIARRRCRGSFRNSCHGAAVIEDPAIARSSIPTPIVSIWSESFRTPIVVSGGQKRAMLGHATEPSRLEARYRGGPKRTIDDTVECNPQHRFWFRRTRPPHRHRRFAATFLTAFVLSNADASIWRMRHAIR